MVERRRIDELRRRVQMDPASIAFAVLAEECRRAGLFEEAIATCRTGLKRHPSYLSARVTLARALADSGRYDEAQAEFEHVLRAAPENLAALRGLGEIHGRHESSHASGPAEPPTVEAPPDPALMALEAFMSAIRQARTFGGSRA